MDKKYIEMCEKATEIQQGYRLRNPAGDDIFAGKIYHGIELFGHLTPTNVPVTDNYIWIPRLEQLLAMLDKTSLKRSDTNKGLLWVQFEELQDFLSYLHHKSMIEYNEKITWEQVLLRFVMSKKFDKIWDGKDWIKVE